MAILPPFPSTLDCPICRSSSAGFVSEPLGLVYRCDRCGTRYTLAEFIEKVSEILAAERAQHRSWQRIIAALAARTP